MARRRARYRDGRINLNTANRARLARIEVIGESGADSILEERDRLGGFSSVNEVDSIRGLTPQARRYLKEHARV